MLCELGTRFFHLFSQSVIADLSFIIPAWLRKALYLQCYDKYFLKSLKKTVEVRGHPFRARGPDNAGSYNSQPHETGFFCDGGEYDGYYGRFFLNWYARILVDHGDRVLSLAKLAFEGTRIAVKVSLLFRNFF